MNTEIASGLILSSIPPKNAMINTGKSEMQGPLVVPNLSKEKLLTIIALFLAGVSSIVSIILGFQVIKLKQDLAHQPFPTPVSTATTTQTPTTTLVVPSTVAPDEVISTSNETTGWETYSNIFFGYSVKYPGDWELTDRPIPQGDDWTYLTSVALVKKSSCFEEKSAAGKPWCGASFTLNVGKNSKDQALETWMREHVGDLPASFGNITVNGVKGVRFLGTAPGHQYLQTEDKVGVVGFARNKTVFILEYRVSGPDPNGSLFNTLELILSTFKFLPVSAEVEEQAPITGQCNRESGIDTCPQGYLCYWSWECPKGIQDCGPPTGDFLCHKECQTNSDCPRGAPFCKEIWLARGDIVNSYHMCMK